MMVDSKEIKRSLGWNWYYWLPVDQQSEESTEDEPDEDEDEESEEDPDDEEDFEEDESDEDKEDSEYEGLNDEEIEEKETELPDWQPVPVPVQSTPEIGSEAGNIVQRFHSVGEYMDYVSSDCGWAGPISHTSGNDHWYGDASWDQAIKLAEHGWEEGVELIEKFTANIVDIISGEIPEPRVKYHPSKGRRFSLDRYLQGDPRVMVQIVDASIRREATPPRIVRVVANLAVSGSQDSKVLQMRGAAVAALVQVLEQHGTRVEIDLCAGNNLNYNGGKRIETWVRLKEAGQVLHMPNLAFHLSHASSFRRLVFSAWEHLNESVRREWRIMPMGGYGYPSEVQDTGDIYLPKILSGGNYGEEGAVKWIEQELKKQGLEVVRS